MQAEPLFPEEEDTLWEQGFLGDYSPQTLLDTRVSESRRDLRPSVAILSRRLGATPKPFLQILIVAYNYGTKWKFRV